MIAMNSAGACHIQAGNLVTRQIASETIIVPLRSSVGELNSIFTLNPMGTKIWEMLQVATPNRAIVQSICREYDVIPEQAETDLAEFLELLSAAGLIQQSLQSEA